MARPQKPEHERRSNGLNIRLTEIERVRAERSAAAYGVGLSEFFRRRALGHRLPAGQIDRQQMAEATAALLRLGVNLNQIAKHVNAGRGTPVQELSDLIARINSAMDSLDESGRTHPRAEL